MTARYLLFIAIAAIVSAGIAPGSALADGASPDEQKTMLSLHNSYRAQHCVPALNWSDKLAADAQRWAENCWIGHDSNRGHIGENIAWGGDRSASSAVDAWYREIDDYDYSQPGFASATAHFTQMIWKDTKEIGCGVARCYLGTVRIWVCRYGPTGNWRGQYEKNVPKRCK